LYYWGSLNLLHHGTVMVRMLVLIPCRFRTSQTLESRLNSHTVVRPVSQPFFPVGWLCEVAVLIAVSCIVFGCLGEAQTKPIRRILILNEVGTSYPLIKLVDRGIQTALATSPYRIEFYREYMETVLFPDPAVQQQFRDFYIQKYRDRKPDVIITVGSSPLNFMVEVHRRAFPGVPIVFCIPNALPGSLVLDSDFTGVEGDVAPGATLAVALRLLPETKHITVVGGTAPYDRQQQAEVKKQLKPYEGHFDISYLTDFAMPVLLERLRHLPKHTMILLTAIGKDAAGTNFNSAEAGPLVAAAANAPIFSLSDRFLNHGEVGGDVSSGAEQGRVAGSMALRLLNGEKPQDIPVIQQSAIYMFDWRALKRWGMKESALPPGSIVLNRLPSFWDVYKYYLLPAILVLLVQAIVIAALLWQRSRRRKAEAELMRSEEKFSRSFRHSPLAITITSANDCRYVDVNEAFERHSGWKRDEVIGRTPFEIGLWVDPDQRIGFLKQLLASGSVRDFEVRFRTKDGQTRTGLGSAEVIEVNGERCALSVIADITERKAAEEALSTVSRRLIEAQDAERARIARELHDDINQRLALLRVNLTTLKQKLPAAEASTGTQIEDACAEMADLGNDIQALSHRLHSSRLEYLGLDAASAGLCREVAERQKIEIFVDCQGIPKDLSSDISFCLFRVLQEALQNAVRHSGATKVEVAFTSSLHEIKLMVRDSGIGFDPATAPTGHGLGLISMRERLKLVDGQLSIDSKLQRGTIILARVPLCSRMDSSGAVA